MEKVLILNPGSTSTKIAVYNGEVPVFEKSIEHTMRELTSFRKVAEQYGFCLRIILKALEQEGVRLSDLDAVVSRGGMILPVETGVYGLSEDMIWQLETCLSTSTLPA